VEDRGSAATPRLSFSLVDFGTAVDAAGWHAGEWCKRGAAGDLRYWPLSAWLIFELDSSGMLSEGGEAARHEYEHCLDFHSVGITALQLLVELSPIEQPTDVQEVQLLAFAAALNNLRAAWKAYWTFVSKCHSDTLEAYADCGHAENLKDDFVAADVHGTVRARLEEMGQAIRALQDACSCVPSDESCAGLDGLLAALLLLIRGAAVGVADLSSSLTWERVLAVLHEEVDEGDCSGPPALDTSLDTIASTASPKSWSSPPCTPLGLWASAIGTAGGGGGYGAASPLDASCGSSGKLARPSTASTMLPSTPTVCSPRPASSASVDRRTSWASGTAPKTESPGPKLPGAADPCQRQGQPVHKLLYSEPRHLGQCQVPSAARSQVLPQPPQPMLLGHIMASRAHTSIVRPAVGVAMMAPCTGVAAPYPPSGVTRVTLFR